MVDALSSDRYMGRPFYWSGSNRVAATTRMNAKDEGRHDGDMRRSPTGSRKGYAAPRPSRNGLWGLVVQRRVQVVV